MTVTKVVGFDLRIPKHFSLHFYDFSTILYEFSKFTALEKKKEKGSLFAQRSLADIGEQRRVGRRRFQRGEAPEVRGKLGKRERGLSRTSGCPWFAGRRSEAAAPQAPAVGGGTVPRQRRSGEGERARSG